MGNDEHSQNVFRKRARELGSSRSPTATGWSGVPRRLAAARHLVRRLHPDDRAAARAGRRRSSSGGSRRRRHLRRALRGLVLRRRARPSSRRRISSTACARSTTQAGLDSEEELLLPACRSISDRCSSTSSEQPEFIQPEIRRNEILRLLERRPRGHLGQPRGAVVGHPAAVRPDERRLRLVRRADQLRHGGRLRHRRGDVRESGGRPTCTSSARTSRGSTACDLAGDADERRPAVAAAGVRPRLGALQGREDEQVARHRGRSAGGALERFGADPLRLYLVKEIAVRQRRRLHLGAVRGALQRRPREQPRQPRQPRRGDGREIAPAARLRRGAGPDVGRQSPTRRDDESSAMDAALHEAASPRCSASSTPPTSSSPSSEPWALARDDREGGSAVAGAVRRRRGAAHRGDAAAAGHAAVVAEILRRVGEPSSRQPTCAWRMPPGGTKATTRRQGRSVGPRRGPRLARKRRQSENQEHTSGSRKPPERAPARGAAAPAAPTARRAERRQTGSRSTTS